MLEPNQTTEILVMQVPEPPSSSGSEFAELEPKRTLTHTVVISARLIDGQTNGVLSRIADWPQPYRFMEFPDPELQVEVSGENVTVNAKKPAKGVVFSIIEGGNVTWSDNGIDVVPGDPQEIIAKGLNGRRLKVAYMGGEKAQDVEG